MIALFILRARITLLLSLMLCAALLFSSDASAEGNWLPIKAAGVTTITRSFDNMHVVVEIAAQSFDIEKPSGTVPTNPKNACTYTRYPCSLVNNITISVNGSRIEVVRSVFDNLSDINRVQLTMYGDLFALSFECGDASNSYGYIVTFNTTQVVETQTIDLGTGYIFSTTIYSPPLTEGD